MTGEPDASHRLQAAALWRRWQARKAAPPAVPAADRIPPRADLPDAAWRHYRHFSWVRHEQRLLALSLAFLAAAVALVWSAALHLRRKPPAVVRSPRSLKEAAADFYGRPEISYDRTAFFLSASLPLLYALDDGGHPLLPLLQDAVAPAIYGQAERRLDAAAPQVRKDRMTQSLTLTGLDHVVADGKSGRIGAWVDGYLTVTARRAEARFFPWRGHVVLQANSAGPYPYYVLRLDQRTGPDALRWKEDEDGPDPAP